MVTKIPPLCHCMLHHTVTSSNNQLQSVTIIIINRFQLVQARSFQHHLPDPMAFHNRFPKIVSFCETNRFFNITTEKRLPDFKPIGCLFLSQNQPIFGNRLGYRVWDAVDTTSDFSIKTSLFFDAYWFSWVMHSLR